MVLRFFLFACVFLFISCADTEFNNPYDPESPNYIGNRLSCSSSVEKSSNSAVLATLSSSSSLSFVDKSSSSAAVFSSSSTPSSSSVGCTAANNTSTQYCSNGTMKQYGSVTYEGQTYKTVVIGTQTWMAQNLNYNVSGSKCYDNKSANCDKYGRLYDWATAMTLLPDCNINICASQISAKHKGICPSDWHIPNDDEWNTLVYFVGGPSIAGTKLKSANGWNLYNGVSSGYDVYGFSALPGGNGYFDGSFDYSGNYGYWWSSSEVTANAAYYRSMYFSGEDTYWDYDYKNNILFSIRCVQD